MLESIKESWFKNLVVAAFLAVITFAAKTLYDLTYPAAKGVRLEVRLNESEDGILLKNGKYPIKITDVIPSLKTKCLVLSKSTVDVSGYVDSETIDSIDLGQMIQISEAKGLVLSENEVWERSLNSDITEDGAICAYDLKVEIRYTPTSRWVSAIHGFLKKIDVVNPKSEIFVRFDGCEYRQIGAGSNKDEIFGISGPVISETLEKCRKVRNPDLYNEFLLNKEKLDIEVDKMAKILNEMSNIELGQEFMQIMRGEFPPGDKTTRCNIAVMIYKETSRRDFLDQKVEEIASPSDIYTTCLGIEGPFTAIPDPVFTK